MSEQTDYHAYLKTDAWYRQRQAAEFSIDAMAREVEAGLDPEGNA